MLIRFLDNGGVVFIQFKMEQVEEKRKFMIFFFM